MRERPRYMVVRGVKFREYDLMRGHIWRALDVPNFEGSFIVEESGDGRWEPRVQPTEGRGEEFLLGMSFDSARDAIRWLVDKDRDELGAKVKVRLADMETRRRGP